jgi:hypothetical protein
MCVYSLLIKSYNEINFFFDYLNFKNNVEKMTPLVQCGGLKGKVIR